MKKSQTENITILDAFNTPELKKLPKAEQQTAKENLTATIAGTIDTYLNAIGFTSKKLKG